MTIYQGVDCTAFQGNIDWRLVKEGQIDFAMLRASMGCENKIQSHTDIHFHRNMHDAAEAGIALGAYHCLLATTVEEAIEESDCFLRTISGYELSYPVAIDIEDRALRYLQKNKLDAVVRAWCSKLREAGYYVMIRATLPTIQNRLSDQTMQEFDLWLIKYGETTDYSGDIGIWQYTGAGSVAGVRGRIGRLRALRDYPSVIQKYSPGTNKKQAVPESSPSIKSPIIQAFDTLYSLSELRESIRVLFEDSDIKKLLSKEPSACKCEHKAESLSVEQTEDQNTDDLNENKHNEPATDEILTENNTFQNDPAQPSESSGFEVGPPQIELSQPDLSPTKPDTPQNKDNMDKTPIPPNEPSSDIEPDSSSEPLQCDECECQFEKLETDRDIMPDLLSLTPKSNVSNLISPNEFEDDEEETEELHNVRRPMRGRWKWLF